MGMETTVQETAESVVEHHSQRKTAMFLFICAEAVVFGCLFAAYFVMLHHQGNGPGPNEFFHFKKIILPTVLLVSSSLTWYFADETLRMKEKGKAMVFAAITAALALGFLSLEVLEFLQNVSDGNTLSRSPFVSSYYLLVGLHGCHVLFGVLWMGLLLMHVKTKGDTEANRGRFASFGIYWHFVDSVWVFIFILLYGLGEIL
ncbi:heme-copper oxidase subunit III [Fictibacillus sp. KU28468]|uniref:cytochrome c oxidase subunit 3 n=1 Tax=Fictibacillus sp. KU28468 TaxID=2991053 RepID=UPI00223D3F51|nr:cytochrome c oxidase subunit 3 [Fictibacillus sp. KU28468]UZJ79277.1 cytochrome c oxidase subunit 3 [Fictibacillus sp. KU28468]